MTANATRTVRDYSKVGDAIPVPDLIGIQTRSYARYLQEDLAAGKRENHGLEALLREMFPIESYDGKLSLHYISYELGKARYTPDECRELRLTYGMPLRIRLRLVRKDSDEIQEDQIYLGDMPIMIGGGEFIINGAERVIVSQLHRSPGVDFIKDQAEGDRALYACRIIPERGSWIEIEVTKKDVLVVRIDQSSKLPATTFLRAMDEAYSTDDAIVGEFFKTKSVRSSALKPELYTVSPILDEETDEVLVRAGCQLGDAVERIQESSVKSFKVISKVSDPLILNTLAEDTSRSHEEALLKIYSRLRSGGITGITSSTIHDVSFGEVRNASTILRRLERSFSRCLLPVVASSARRSIASARRSRRARSSLMASAPIAAVKPLP